MRLQRLKEAIRSQGRAVGDGILKVDGFLNHQIDVDLLCDMGRELHERFAGERVTKLLTVEASGIAVACAAAMHFHVPVLFAKKSAAANMDEAFYESQVESFTRNKTYTIRVSKQYLTQSDRVLIIDDFLANGQAVLGLLSLCDQARAHVVGAGIAIEKGFQPGGALLRARGLRVESLAIIDSIRDGVVALR